LPNNNPLLPLPLSPLKLRETPWLNSLSVYLHVPFCTEKCDYCDFFSVPTQKDDSLIGRYVDALLKETERRLLEAASGNSGIAVPSIYIGGGTPSLLGADGIARLLDGIRAIIGALPGSLGGTSGPCEISVEANPETADSAFLRACADHGVNRLSLGVQSFDRGFREALGRRGRGNGISAGTEHLSRRLSEAAEIFGSRLSVDLLCGVLPAGDGPVENGSVGKNRVLHDIDKALFYSPGHVSLYALTIEKGTPLADRLSAARTGKGESADDETIWLAGRDALIKAGFDHYEISNFALGDENRCIHNIRYWLMNNWIGVGPGASGTIIAGDGTGRRTSYAPDVEGFLSGTIGPLTEDLDRATVIKETLLMGYRYVDGPDPALFARRFGKTLEEAIPRTLAKWQNGTERSAFREKRMLFLNAFLLDAFLELEDTI